MPLTDTTVRNAKSKEKPYKLSDERGMYLEVVPTGGKYWRLKYRIDGKEKRISLGVYPDVSLADARERREEARKLIAKGIDPSAQRQAEKHQRLERAANTFEAVARKWWQEQAPSWSPAYGARVLSRLERDVFPILGKTPIEDVAAPHLRRLSESIRKRGVLETAKRALQEVGQVLLFADLPDIAESHRAKLPAAVVRHMAAVTSPEEVGALMRAIDGYSGSAIVRSALRLAPLVFVRPGELRHARWAEIDLNKGTWSYLVTKTKTDHLVPLSSQALEILCALQPITGHSEFVFPGQRGGRPISENTLNSALATLGYANKHTAHGFRAMARTLLAEELHYKPEVIEHQLAHSVPDALGKAYNRTRFIKDRTAMMQQWADYLDKLKAGAEVIPLKGNTAA